jgi:c-di-GMP-binding flagellar brake protein YcgR
MSLDFSSNDELNKQILKTNDITFETNVGGVPVSFTLAKVSKPLLNRKKIFTLDFPEELIWLERRAFHRIKTPLQNTPTCKLTFIITDELDNDLPCHLKADLLNLSLTGTAFSYDPTQYPPNTFIDIKEITNCIINLPGIGRFSTTIEIRNQRPKKISEPDKMQILGVKFYKLSTAIESQLQRYMLLVEREQRSKFK